MTQPQTPRGVGGYPQNSSIKALLLKIFSIRALWVYYDIFSQFIHCSSAPDASFPIIIMLG